MTSKNELKPYILQVPKGSKPDVGDNVVAKPFKPDTKDDHHDYFEVSSAPRPDEFTSSGHSARGSRR